MKKASRLFDRLFAQGKCRLVGSHWYHGTSEPMERCINRTRMTDIAAISISQFSEAKGKEKLTMSTLRWRPSWRLGIVLAFGIVGAIIAYSCESSLAQITPDATLGTEGSVITPNTNVRGLPADLIQGGATRGANLFHSFSEFNVGDGQRVYFANPAGIENILTRVTGNTLSNILGTLGVNGTADLFLLNPNGIIFGPNARLDLGGSFFATTANAVQFGDRGFWSATNPEVPSPLLTINPSAFLFNQVSIGNIVNNSRAPAGLDPSGFRTSGLRVPDGQSLLLLGGNVRMNSGRLNAFGGRVEIGAVGGLGTVGLNPDGSLSFPEALPRADVSLSLSSIDVAADNGGSVSINAGNLDISSLTFIRAGVRRNIGTVDSQAGDITLNATGTIRIAGLSYVGNTSEGGNSGDIRITTDSLFLSDAGNLSTSTFGQGNAGNVIINARNQISLDGGNLGAFSSSISSNVEANAVGRGGDVRITTGSLSLTNGAQLSANTLGQGSTGNVIIDARDTVSLDNRATISSNVEANATGQGGEVRITTGSLSLTNGALLDANTFGRGDGGNIIIEARDSVSFVGNGFLTAAFSIVGGTGNGTGGDIRITTGSLFVTDGAGLVAGTDGQGDAGNVIINARESVVFEEGDAFSTATSRAIGDGGNVEITTGSLEVRNGGQLIVSSRGEGRAGNILIDARDRVLFAGESSDNQRGSGAFSRLSFGAVGQGGNVEITTGSLDVIDGAQLSTATFGRGNAGNIIINARAHVSFDGTNSAVTGASGAFSTVEEEAVGDGGNIEIAAGSLSITNGGGLSASTFGRGNAGNIILNVRDWVSLDDARIRSRIELGAVGNSGRIEITTGSLSVSNGTQLSSATFGEGNANDVIINARDHVLIEGSNGDREPSGAFSTVEKGAVGDGGNIAITTSSLSLINQGTLSARTFGQGSAGDVLISAPYVSLDSSNVLSSVEEGAVGDGGNIEITTGSLFLTNKALLSANLIGQGNAGNVIITARDLVSLDDGYIFSSVLPGAVGDGGNIEITTGSLFSTNLGSLFAATSGEGNAGDVIITARDRVSLDNGGIFSSVLPQAIGDGGKIEIMTGSLSLSNGSQLNASTRPNSTGVGGTISLRANTISLADRAQISASSQSTGRAGDVAITADEAVRLTNSDITTSAEQASGGSIAITTDSLSLNRGRITAATGTTGAQGAANITLQGLDLLLMGNESLISANALNQANGGNVAIDSTFIVATPPQGPLGSDITANASRGNGGRVSITTQGLFGIEFRPKLTPNNDITVSSDFGLAGVFEQNTPGVDPSRGLAELPTEVVDASRQIDRRCSPDAAARNSSFTVTGRGGLPPSPNDPLQGEAVITNWVSLDSEVENNTPPATTTPSSSAPRQLVEAQGWVFNERGEVVLTASAPTVTPDESGFQELNCNPPTPENAQEP